MDLKHRLQTAIKEDGNIVALAGTAALSLALLNPLPILIGLVAETIYLMYVPDSRWYANRLSHRYDAEVRGRRMEIRARQFGELPSSVSERWDDLEALRGAISARNISEKPEWLKFLRRVDYLMEIQLQGQGTATILTTRIESEGTTPSGMEQQIAEGADRLAYFESTTKALYDIAREAPDESTKSGLKANIEQAERQKSHTQQEIFDMIASQHLIETADAIAVEVADFLRKIRDADGLPELPLWESELQRLTMDAEQSLRRLTDSLKRNR